MSESSFFDGAHDFNLNDGKFGPDHSQNTTHIVSGYRHYGCHTADPDSYVNRGQRADNDGALNRIDLQTTNHGPFYHGYHQHVERRGESRRFPGKCVPSLPCYRWLIPH